MENREPDPKQVEQLRELCDRSPGLRRFFEDAAGQQYGRTITNVTSLAEKSGLPYNEALEVAKRVDYTGVANYIIGRRGSKTRLEWRYTTKLLAGYVLNGAAVEDEPDDDTDEGELKISKEFALKQARQLIARAYGVTSDAVQISVNLTLS